MITKLAAFFPPLVLALAACSSAPDDAPQVSVDPTVTDPLDGVRCGPHARCAAGEYCDPVADGTCGAGTCKTSPGACPMLDEPVCGCDGHTYLNSCWATISQGGKPGTTSAGSLFVAPTMAALAGTWVRVSGGAKSETIETLVLDRDSTYTLTERICGEDSSCTRSGSAGTFGMSTVGMGLDVTTTTGPASLATEFYLENTCPIGGPLQLVGEEPPGSGTMVALTRQ